MIEATQQSTTTTATILPHHHYRHHQVISPAPESWFYDDNIQQSYNNSGFSHSFLARYSYKRESSSSSSSSTINEPEAMEEARIIDDIANGVFDNKSGIDNGTDQQQTKIERNRSQGLKSSEERIGFARLDDENQTRDEFTEEFYHTVFPSSQHSLQTQDNQQYLSNRLFSDENHTLEARSLSKLVGSPPAAPSWTELTSEVLPAAAREVLSSSFHRIYHSARLTYSQTKWAQQYSEYGNNATGYFVQGHRYRTCYPLGYDLEKEIASSSSKLKNLVRFDDLPRFSSLSWTDRQLVKEWRTYYPGTNEVPKESELNYETENRDLDESEEINDEDADFDCARTLVPTPLERPVWEQSDVCFACHKTFGPTLLRHHCRLCGKSVCHNDSRHTRKLPQFGYHPDVPERVCDACALNVWEQSLAERIVWRLARCRDYINGTLAPYFEAGYDSVEQKAYRIAETLLTLAKSIPLGAQATVAVETADVLRKYGLNGIYTIMLRQEFLAAADLLRKALGINQTAWPLSVHELSAAIFYALAQHRAMRGIHPDREHVIHGYKRNALRKTNLDSEAGGDLTKHDIPKSDTHDSQQSITDKIESSETLNPTAMVEDSDTTYEPVCDPVPDSVISSLVFYAPIALNFIYMEKEVDMQLLAAQQGWRLVYAYLNSEREGANVGMVAASGDIRPGNRHIIHDRPASALFAHDEQKIACLAIRGTSTIHDVITDIRQIPVPFPESATFPLSEGNSNGGNDKEWTDVTLSAGGVAVAGMASAAFNLYREHIDSLVALARQGFRIRIVGHSLGGAVATLLAVLVDRDLKELSLVPSENCPKTEFDAANQIEEGAPIRVYGYGTPSCVDAILSDLVEPLVSTVVLHDDVVPRLSPTACRGLLKHLLHIRETWVRTQLPDDIRAFADRAKMAWAPRWRGGFTLPSATTSSLRLQRYYRKTLQNGRARILSVKRKIVGKDDSHTGNDFSNSYSVSYRSFDKSRRSFVDDATVEVAQSNDEFQDEEVDDEDTEKGITEPRLVMDYMGVLDASSGGDGMVVDGDEFFDPESLLSSAYEENEDSTCSSEVFDDSRMSQSIKLESKTYIQSNLPQGNQNLRESEEVNVNLYDSLVNRASTESIDQDESAEAVVLEEMPLPRMFVPGRIIHLYSHRGVYKAAFVPKDFRELRRISMAGNMLSDHKTKSYYEALLEVRSVRRAHENPPIWTSFDEGDKCSCCASRFTWASTSDSEAQEARDKHNCRSCGALVCHPCSENRVPIPSIGLTTPARVCDRCYYNDIDGFSLDAATSKIGHESYGSTKGTNEAWLTRADSKPTRNRTKRSAVIDDLASRFQASPFRK